jgi:hypothetical protein
MYVLDVEQLNKFISCVFVFLKKNWAMWLWNNHEIYTMDKENNTTGYGDMHKITLL